MPNYHKISAEIRKKIKELKGDNMQGIIQVRTKYLSELHKHTKRNIIIYYSGWLQKPDFPGTIVNDIDINGLMTVIYKLDRKIGVDLILHTPGGNATATESIVTYLREMFDTNIRVIVPQLAMSAGTVIACAAECIVMGKQSSLGPIDPQLNGIAAHGIVEEFQRACKEIKKFPSRVHVWQPIIDKYPPTFVGECEKSIQLINEVVKKLLVSGMFSKKDELIREILAEKIVKELGDHALTKSHDRHLSAKRCKDIGLNIEMLENDDKFQDLVLSIHHAYMYTFAVTPALKIFENHTGTGMGIDIPLDLQQQESN